LNPRSPIPFSKRTAFTLIALVGAWLCIESATLLYWVATRRARPAVKPIYQPHPYRGFYPRPNTISADGTYSTNSHGLRGPEIPTAKSSDTIRIVCLGGSTTLSIGATTDTHTYPARLEALLRLYYRDRPFRIEVLNAGVGAACSIESLVSFETRLLDFAPDIAIFHHVMNDAWLASGVPGFQSDYSHARRPFVIPPRGFWEWSPALSLLFARRSILNPYFPSREVDLLGIIAAEPGDVRKAGPKYGALTPEMIAAYERNVGTFVALARGNGVVPVLATEVLYDDRPTSGRLFEAVAAFNDVLRAVARREKVGLIDFDAVMDWNSTAFYDSAHLIDSPAGLGFKGYYFAKSMIDLGAIERVYEARSLGLP
jgi:hypothetical protein